MLILVLPIPPAAAAGSAVGSSAAIASAIISCCGDFMPTCYTLPYLHMYLCLPISTSALDA